MALFVSLFGIGHVLFIVAGNEGYSYLFDVRSITVVVGGTVAVLLFQFDFWATFQSLAIMLRSLLGVPDRQITKLQSQIDDAIMKNKRISELQDGSKIDGNLLNDVLFMHRQGMVFEEIDAFVTARIQDDFLKRDTAVQLFHKAAQIAPALGLFGTVLGLIEVLRTLSDPAQMGPSMSLALMTTAYGAALGSLVFTPISGRLEHHNKIIVQAYEQLLGKVSILLFREEFSMDPVETQDSELAQAV